MPWWRCFKKSEVVAVDVEKVNLVGIKGRVKPGKIGIVNSKFETIVEKDVYQKPDANVHIVKLKYIYKNTYL